MEIAAEFPSQIYLNLGVDEIRRRAVEERFAQQGMVVVRQASVDGRWLRGGSRGYAHPCRAALAITKRLAIRRASATGARGVLLFEDDVVFHPDFAQRVAAIELPEDWGMFFLGCLHMELPEQHGPGLVRVRRAYDHHAWAVRAEYFEEVRRAMRGSRVTQGLAFSDHRIAELQRHIPTYAAWPNLVWQDRELWGNHNYDVHGGQVVGPEAVREELCVWADSSGRPGMEISE